MPRKVANNMPNNPNCVGENVSPQLSWTGVPDGTKSFAILMEDPEGRGGAGVHHWVAYGIPASVTSFAEGEVSKPSDKYVGGKSTQGVGNYSGPCTPPGTPHHYTFVVIATDLDPKELPPGLTREEFLAKLVPPADVPRQGHGRHRRSVREAELVDRITRSHRWTAAVFVNAPGGPRPFRSHRAAAPDASSRPLAHAVADQRNDRAARRRRHVSGVLLPRPCTKIVVPAALSPDVDGALARNRVARQRACSFQSH